MVTRIHKRIPEFGGLYRDELGARGWRELRRVDERRLRARQPLIFDWSRRDRVRARNLVGVVETPGLALEILPKVDPGSSEGSVAPNAARNLVHMLSVSGGVPTHAVGSAGLELQTVDLLDVFARSFAGRLLDEILKGVHRDYSRYEDELSHVRGQILLQHEMRRPPWMRHRISVRFDEYDENSIVNQTLKAAAVRLLGLVSNRETVALLARILDELDAVEGRTPSRRETAAIRFDRMNQRFTALFSFAQAVLYGESPTLRSGDLESFSIVFPMDALFEGFFARSLVRHARHLRLRRGWIHTQARGRRRWLLRTEPEGPDVLKLRPDVVLDRDGCLDSMLVDTKWKRLLPDAMKPLNGIDAGDIYQVVTYAVRYQCDEAVLVYPKVEGVSPKSFRLPGVETRIRLALLDVRRDLAKDVGGLRADLRNVIYGDELP